MRIEVIRVALVRGINGNIRRVLHLLDEHWVGEIDSRVGNGTTEGWNKQWCTKCNPAVGLISGGEIPQDVDIWNVQLALPKSKVGIEIRVRNKARQGEELKPVPLPNGIGEQVGDGG